MIDLAGKLGLMDVQVSVTPTVSELCVGPLKRQNGDRFVGSLSGPRFDYPALQRPRRHLSRCRDLPIGIERLAYLSHAADESVDPSQIEHFVLAEALFLENDALATR